jgi:hypothetical protein
LARERRALVEAWSQKIKQPKHLILTAKNTDDFSEAYLRWFKKQFAKLRRRKITQAWRGGFYSIETTWTVGEGAHVHLHVLVDADWINISQIAVEWGKLMGQDFAICKVKDVRKDSYLQELCKYVAKGSQMVKWPGLQLTRFIDAIANVRLFGVFGSLYGERKAMADFLAELHRARNVCECGCNNYRFFTESEWDWEILTRELAAAIPPPKPAPDNRQLKLFAA